MLVRLSVMKMQHPLSAVLVRQLVAPEHELGVVRPLALRHLQSQLLRLKLGKKSVPVPV